jgi:hypothetical protein
MQQGLAQVSRQNQLPVQITGRPATPSSVPGTTVRLQPPV